MVNAGNHLAVRHMWEEMCSKSSCFVDSRSTNISVYSQGLGVMVRQHSCNCHLLHLYRGWSEVGLGSVLFCQSMRCDASGALLHLTSLRVFLVLFTGFGVWSMYVVFGWS